MPTFHHSAVLRAHHPDLVAGVLRADGLHARADAGATIAALEDAARARLAGVAAESELPEIQAWRRAFARMGLKPTQYRCASESLLRRFKKEDALPRIHPLIDLCNAASLASAIPVAVFDLDHVAGDLEVRPAHGDEAYLGFDGETEAPAPGEIVFADAAGRAHARRWTHRQSGLSAVREGTSRVLVVCEAMHSQAATDVPRLLDTLAQALVRHWGVAPRTALLSPADPALVL